MTISTAAILVPELYVLFEIELVCLLEYLIILLSLASQVVLNLVLCLYGLMKSIKELFLNFGKSSHFQITPFKLLDIAKLLLRL